MGAADPHMEDKSLKSLSLSSLLMNIVIFNHLTKIKPSMTIYSDQKLEKRKIRKIKRHLQIKTEVLTKTFK